MSSEGIRKGCCGNDGGDDLKSHYGQPTHRSSFELSPAKQMVMAYAKDIMAKSGLPRDIADARRTVILFSPAIYYRDWRRQHKAKQTI